MCGICCFKQKINVVILKFIIKKEEEKYWVVFWNCCCNVLLTHLWAGKLYIFDDYVHGIIFPVFSMERKKSETRKKMEKEIKWRTKCQLSRKSFSPGKSESSFRHGLYPISLVSQLSFCKLSIYQVCNMYCVSKYTPAHLVSIAGFSSLSGPIITYTVEKIYVLNNSGRPQLYFPGYNNFYARGTGELAYLTSFWLQWPWVLF